MRLPSSKEKGWPIALCLLGLILGFLSDLLPLHLPPALLSGFASLSIVVFAYYTYQSQREVIYFHRRVHQPSIIINRELLEQENKIQVENTEVRIAYDIYIGSFLLSEAAEDPVVLYEEIQAFIAKDYPILQANLLRPDFRADEADEDEQNYGASLRSRIETFVSRQSGKSLVLLVAVRSLYHEAKTSNLFFYRANPVSQIENAKWASFHVNRSSDLYKKASKLAIRSFRKEQKRHALS